MATILLPLDGSAFAEQAIPHAVGRLGSADELLLLQVVQHAATLGALDMAFDPVDMTGAQTYLEKIAQPLQERGLNVRTQVKPGDPRETIPLVAETEKVALIVLASHGHTGWQRWLLGSVAESVARLAPCPVWVVRCAEKSGPPEPQAIRRILLPLDVTRSAHSGVDYAVKTFPKTVNLVLLAATNMAWVGRTDAAGEVVQEVRAALDKQAAALRAEGWSVDVVVDPGVAAEAILEQAAGLQVDLIAMGSHGRTGAERWFMGSVAEKVLRHAPCPVVIVR